MDRAVMQRTIVTIRLFEQMNKVINQAGGSAFTWEALMKMPVAELLSLLAPNSIEFVYTAGAKKTE